MSGPSAEGPLLVIPPGTAACLECGDRWTGPDAEERSDQHHRKTRHVTASTAVEDSPGKSPSPG